MKLSVNYFKAKYYFYNKKWSKSVFYFESICKAGGTFGAKDSYQIGFTYSKLKKWKEAVPFLKKAAEASSDNYRWQYRYAIALENINQNTLANKIFITANNKNVTESQFFKAGVLLAGFSRPLYAEEQFKKAISLNSHNSIYYENLAGVLNTQRKWWQELEALEKAIEINPSNADLNYKLANSYERMSNFTNAIKSYESAISLNSSKAEWYYRLGYSYERSGIIEQAEKAYEKCIKLSKSSLSISSYHQKRGLWPEVINALEKLKKVNSRSPEFFYSLGMAYDRCYLWEKAAENYRKAIALKGGNPNYYFRMGYVLEKSTRWLESAKFYEMACRASDRHNSHLFYRLGYVSIKAKQFEKACYAFAMMNPSRDAGSKGYTHKIFSSNPWTADEFYQRGIEIGFLGNHEKSVKFIESALQRKHIHEPEWHFQLGYRHFKLGNFEKACQSFLELRTFTKAYGVPLDKYTNNNKLKYESSYLEYYNRLPIRKDVFLFESYHGASASCNPYAIFKELYKRKDFSKCLFVWVLRKDIATPRSLLRKKNVIIIYRGTDAYLRYLASAKYLINNVSFPEYFIRKEGQLYLNTWHGTPIKYLGKDIKDSYLSHANVSKNFLQATHIISQNDYTNDILLDRYDVSNICSARILATGYPRIDITKNTTEEQKAAIRKKMGIPFGMKVVLYAPTWRGVHGKATFNEKSLIDDLNAMNSSGAYVVFRGHHMVEHSLKNVSVPVMVAPSEIETNELLTIVDVLVTDYSSIAFDFLCLRKPIIYYMHDLQEYEKERGLYLTENELPGKVCYNQDDLKKEIFSALQSNKLEAPETLIEKYAGFDDGFASKRVVDFFLRENEDSKHHPAKAYIKRLVIYAGAFIPNGIGTSIVNLLNNIDYDSYYVTLVVDVNSVKMFPERLEMLSKLPEKVQILGVVGQPFFDPEEKWVSEKFDVYKKFPSSNMEKVYLTAYQREYKRIFGASRVDAVINFEGYNKKWVSLFASIETPGVKRIIYQHNDMLSEFKARFPYLECNFNLYNKFDNIVSVSLATSRLNEENLSRLYNINGNKFCVAENVQDPAYVLRKSTEGIDEDLLKLFTGYTFITLGRLSPEKDHKKLIVAFKRLKDNNLNCNLLILGDGPLRSELQNLINTLKLEESVTLLGRKNNPYSYLKKADAFVLSSNHEGQPMVLFEALILKKPILATDIIANRGVLGECYGKLVDNSIDGLYEGMRDFVDQKPSGDDFDIVNYQRNAINMFYNLIR
ncbi:MULTISPECIES: CDP-glycerol glycerophosphotransferase family protein [Atlantibacter]|nr:MULTISPECIES: CDP-glycerol glycerophosphotransferase family protein [Atlantibacter]